MISLCMIVKNEEDVLGRCLNSVYEKLCEVVDEIIIVDTGSSDNTVDIAKAYDCDVYDFEWCNDFSKARNFGIEKAKNDWILVLDADEYVEQVSLLELVNLQNGDYDNVRCHIEVNNLNDDNKTIDISNVPRVFNRNYFSYVYNIHEQVGVRPGVAEAFEYKLKFRVSHTGYSRSTIDIKNKTERNKKLIYEYLEENSADPYMRGHLGVMYFREGNYREAIKHYELAVFNDVDLNIEILIKYTNEYIESLLALEEYEKALQCEQVWDKCSISDGYIFAMAKVYIKTNNLQKTVNALLMCINWETERTIEIYEPCYLIGQILELSCQYEQASYFYVKSNGFGDSTERIENIKRMLENKPD